tara:strand:+ start:475 stop:1347 length:873 start_codon:yes stop_codon:yes gene_type:complete
MGNCQTRAENDKNFNFCECIDEHSKCEGSRTNQLQVNLPEFTKCDIEGQHKWIHKTLNCKKQKPNGHGSDDVSDAKKQAALGLCEQDKDYDYLKKKCKEKQEGFINIFGSKERNTPPYIKNTEIALKKQIDSENDKLDTSSKNCIYGLNPAMNDYNNELDDVRSIYNIPGDCNNYKIDNNNCSGLDVRECGFKRENISRQCNEKIKCIQRGYNKVINGYQNINNNNLTNNINDNIDNNNLTNNIMYLLLIIFLIYILKKKIKKNSIKNLLLLIIIILLIFISSYININYV